MPRSRLGGVPYAGQGCRPAHSSRLLADNPLRLTQVATTLVMPLAGLLGVLHRDVESEVKPSETTALTADLNRFGLRRDK